MLLWCPLASFYHWNSLFLQQYLSVEADDPVWWDECLDMLRSTDSIRPNWRQKKIKTMEKLDDREKLEFLLEHVTEG